MVSAVRTPVQSSDHWLLLSCVLFAELLHLGWDNSVLAQLARDHFGGRSCDPARTLLRRERTPRTERFIKGDKEKIQSSTTTKLGLRRAPV